MSYDFLMFKAKVVVNSQADLSDSTVDVQTPDVVMSALAKLFPTLHWKKSRRAWWAKVEDDDGYYEFQVSAEPSQAWNIHASHGTSTGDAIPRICKALGLVAFDAEAMKLIDEHGERDASAPLRN
jgi:hypothetical protein